MKAAAVPLSVALTVASGAAFAQSASDPIAHLRACSLMEHAERLECLENLSRNIAPPARAALGGDNWIVSETTSPVDYTPVRRQHVSSRRLGWFLDAALHSLPRWPHRTGGRRTGRPQRRGLRHDDRPVQLAAGPPRLERALPSRATSSACCGRFPRRATSPSVC